MIQALLMLSILKRLSNIYENDNLPAVNFTIKYYFAYLKHSLANEQVKAKTRIQCFKCILIKSLDYRKKI